MGRGASYIAFLNKKAWVLGDKKFPVAGSSTLQHSWSYLLGQKHDPMVQGHIALKNRAKTRF